MSGGDGSPRVLALAGGKGGVGTSLLAANLAIHLARQGQEVVLADLSIGGPSLHIHLGIDFPSRNLGELLKRKPAPLADMLVVGGIPNLRFLAGVPDQWTSSRQRPGLGGEILRELEDLECDVVVADVGAGRSVAVQMACRAASSLLLVSTPEPASLRGTLQLHAAVLYGAVEEALGSRAAAQREGVLAGNGLRGLLAEIQDDSEAHEKLIAAVRRRRFGLILNQARTAADAEAATRLGAVMSMIQAVVTDPVVCLEYDLSVIQAVTEARVLSQQYPNAPASRGLERLAQALLSPPAARSSVKGHERYAPLSTWNHYRLLALEPKATPREVQRHYEWIRSPFMPGAEAEAVVSRSQLDGVLAQVENAYRTLVFLENRREYDRQLVGAGVLAPSDLAELRPELAAESEDVPEAPVGRAPGHSRPTSRTAHREAPTATLSDRPPEPRPETPGDPDETSRSGEASKPDMIPLSAEPGTAPSDRAVPGSGGSGRYSGAVLRSLRERRRLEVERIATITKIRVQQIEAMESERFQDLPVPVFLRGFLRAYARCLDLDAEEVVRDYMESYDAWRGRRP